MESRSISSPVGSTTQSAATVKVFTKKGNYASRGTHTNGDAAQPTGDGAGANAGTCRDLVS